MQLGMSRHDIPCSLCGKDFFPSGERWYRWRRGQPTYCTRVCVAAKHAAEAHARNPDRPCTICGKMFVLTDSQREKIKTRPNTGLYCSKPCLYLSRGQHSRARWESGKMPAWGSPAQMAARDRLVAHNRDNKRTGPAHPQWKGGYYSKEAKEERRVRWEQEKARRASVPQSVPCMLCGADVPLTSQKRSRWLAKGTDTRFCCESCWKNLNKKSPAQKSQVLTRREYRPAELIASGYYDDASCHECKTVFTPSLNQRTHRKYHPDAHLCCSSECLGAFRARNIMKYREIHGIMEGPTHPSWKGGGHSKQVQETLQLITKIKKFINQGANQ